MSLHFDQPLNLDQVIQIANSYTPNLPIYINSSILSLQSKLYIINLRKLTGFDKFGIGNDGYPRYKIVSSETVLYSHYLDFIPNHNYEYWKVVMNENLIDETMMNPTFAKFISSLKKITFFGIGISDHCFSEKFSQFHYYIKNINPYVQMDVDPRI